MSLVQHMDDQDTWNAFLKGEKEAYASLYDKYFSPLYEYGIRFSDNSELVKDSIQDLFVKLWTNKQHLRPATTVKAYLFTALRNNIFNKRSFFSKKQQEERSLPGFDYFKMTYNIEQEIIRGEEDREREKRIVNALNNLPSRQKEAVYLRFYAGLSYQEIAALMQISVKSSYKAIGKAIDFLRTYYKDVALYLLLILPVN